MQANSVTLEKPKMRSKARQLEDTIKLSIDWLVRNQYEEGYWVGTLESNSCMEAEWILAQHVLGVRDDPKYAGVVKSILHEQRKDGAWDVYYGAKGGDINTTVECYTALRTAGLDPRDQPLKKAREWILKHGGLHPIRNFTKYWLAILGEWPWQHVPALPPELIFLPKWVPFNIYQFASWARGTIIPLTILSARRFTRPLPKTCRLDELYPKGRENFDYRLPKKKGWYSSEGLFFGIDRVLQTYKDFPIKPMRETAIRLCLEWIVKHQEADGAWSGIQPPWIYSLMALRAEGYALNHPIVSEGLNAFNKHWKRERDDRIYLQASESPVWDTVLSMLALLDCEESIKTNRALLPSLHWILNEQVTSWGDWQVYVKDVPSGGWAFEFDNDIYPDVDDTAVALIVLEKLKTSFDDKSKINRAIQLGTQWMVGMQCKNGGWAAFDRDNDHKLLTKIPFADFGELLDPASVDVTGHVLEALGLQGRRIGDPVIDRAVKFIKNEQESEGSWFGRWGCNHIYGTAAVLPALESVGEDMQQPYIRKSAEWIVAHQNKDGGWGETCASYMDDHMRGVGKSTASQTAWALIALLALCSHDFDDSIQKGIEFLIHGQLDEGTWDEPEYTGTGFPGYGVGERISINDNTKTELNQSINLERAFMINYNMYRHYFPLMALGRARKHFANIPV